MRLWFKMNDGRKQREEGAGGGKPPLEASQLIGRQELGPERPCARSPFPTRHSANRMAIAA